MDILLRNIGLGDSRKDIAIEGGVITKIASAGTLKANEGCEVKNCIGRQAVPGFVNMHAHSPMCMMRGIGEDVLFQDWLSHIWKVEENVDREFVYWSTKLACLEMLRSGTTTFNDHYWHFASSEEAAREMGVRIATGYDLMDRGSEKVAQKQRIQCRERTAAAVQRQDAQFVCTLAFHAIYSVSEDLMLWAGELAREFNIPLHIHLAETAREVENCKAAHGGLTPVEYLDRLGLLSDKLIAAHTLHLTPHDVQLLGEHRVTCVHNINSNTKLASGYRFLYQELRDAGANVCIGTDGSASSNNFDMLEAMKTSALVQKAWRGNPAAMPLSELMSMATANGARALGLNSGTLEVGRIADICIVNTDSVAFLSPAPFLANYVYSAHSDCIESVLVNGRFVMRDRKIDGEDEIMREARRVMKKIC